MLFNKYCISVLFLSFISSVTVADDISVLAEEGTIKELLDAVPDSAVEREKEKQKYAHLVSVLEEQKKIEQARSNIRGLQSKTTQDNVVESVPPSGLVPIEQQIQRALLEKNTPNKSSTGNGKSQSDVFKNSISLISLYGNPKSPTADIIIDKRSAEIRIGSNINGWKVRAITSEYVEVGRSKKVRRVFYSNGTGD